MPAGIAAAFSGISATTASVVRMFFAIDAAFCSAERVTIVGSMMPAFTRSSYSPESTFRPKPGFPSRIAFTTIEPSRPALDASWRIGSSSARVTMAAPVRSSPSNESIDPSGLDGDEATGAEIIRRSLEEPIRQIAANSGLEGSVVVNKIQGLKPGEGLDADTGEYGDLIKAGVIDPTMVTRSALQNAASIAKNILTTEAIVAEPPEKDGGGMPGGMPDMGGMM